MWIPWVAVFAGLLTCASALRAGGRIFLGWGPPHVKESGQDSSDGDGKNEEQPETEGGHSHTPACMLLPAIALLVCGLFLGLYPGLPAGAWQTASRFCSTSAYAAHVLDNARWPGDSAAKLPAVVEMRGLLVVLAAVLIAFVHLKSAGARNMGRRLETPLELLRMLHSGHIGDYVTFLTLGIATFGAAVLLLL